MKRKIVISFLFLNLLLLGFAPLITAQNLVIFTGYEPKIQDADKLNEQPVIVDTTRHDASFDYMVNSKEVKVEYQPDTISAVKMKSEPLTKLHRIYLKAGFGNYLTPYVDVSINSLRHRRDVYSFRYHHLSSRGIISGVGEPWMSNNEGYADYKHLFRKHTIKLAGEYHRNVVHYYGFDPVVDSLITRDSTKQTYNRFDLDVNFFSRYRTDSINFNHDVNLKFYHLFDRYGSFETKFKVYGGFNKMTDFFAREFMGINLDYAYMSTHNDSIGSQPVHFFNINPFMDIGGKNWFVRLGFKFGLIADTVPHLGIWPDIRFQWNIFRQYVAFYANATGQFQRRSFRSLYDENPFIMPVVNMGNQNEYIRVNAGLKGQFFENLSYDVGIKYSYINNFHYFINDTNDVFRRGFNVIYDNSQYMNVYGELAFMLGEKLYVTAKGNYHLYVPDNLPTVFHRPVWDASVGARYNLNNKLIFTADLYFRGGQFAQGFDVDTVTGIKTPTVVSLDPQIDLNLGAEYRINKMISLWVNFNNLAAWRYNRWYNYPTQQFNVLGGFTFGI